MFDLTQIESFEYVDVEQVYDIEVEMCHNYYIHVGFDMLVHNSSKTYSIVQLLFIKAKDEPKSVITIAGQDIPNLKKGAYRDAETIYNNSKELQTHILSWNKTDRLIYFKNGSIIEFNSYQNEQDAKSGKRDYLFVNEANGISWIVFFQLAIRTRNQIFLDYNPTFSFWAHDKLINTTPESNELSATVKLIISDHRHNYFLSSEEHSKIEGIKDRQLWLVYARGKTGNITGLIFPEWQKIPDEQFPNDAEFFGGLDFGYTNDPTASVKIARVGESIFLHEMCYTPGISPIQMKQIFEANGFTENNTIYCEHDPDNIAQLRRLGIMAIPARKGQGSINAGIVKLKEFKVFYTASSKNLEIEKQKYMWLIDPVTGKSTNAPVDSFNHCFTGETLIETEKGLKRIDKIKHGDKVLSSTGKFNPVLKVFNNGLKPVVKYLIELDTFNLSLCCTKEHLLKTNEGWTEISKLKSGMIIYLSKSSMGRSINYTLKKNTLAGAIKDFTRRCGNFIVGKSKKDSTYTISMKILGITTSETSNKSKQTNIYQYTLKKDSRKTQGGQKNFNKKESYLPLHGTKVLRALSGINSTQKNAVLETKHMEMDYVKYAEQVSLKTRRFKNIAQKGKAKIIADKKHYENEELVYDLMVESEHEYFANGILVHNCIDSIRYGVYTQYFTE